MSDPRLESVNYVQWFLDSLNPGDSFTVIFLTIDGEQRRYTGKLQPNGQRRDSVAFLTDQGYKRFDRNRVLYIGRE